MLSTDAKIVDASAVKRPDAVIKLLILEAVSSAVIILKFLLDYFINPHQDFRLI